MRSYWLKVVGMGESGKPIEDNWKTHRRLLERSVMFPKRPRRIKAGDTIVLYAAGWRVIFAAGEATTIPYSPPSVDPKYPWLVDVVWEEDSTLPFVHHGIPLAALGVDGKSVRQQSHISLTEEQYRAAIRSLRGAKAGLSKA
jgi:hypothetical protein